MTNNWFDAVVFKKETIKLPDCKGTFLRIFRVKIGTGARNWKPKIWIIYRNLEVGNYDLDSYKLLHSSIVQVCRSMSVHLLNSHKCEAMSCLNCTTATVYRCTSCPKSSFNLCANPASTTCQVQLLSCF